MKDNSRSMTIVFAVLALGGLLFAADRCAAVRDLRAEGGKAGGAAKVAEAERKVLEWERHLYRPAGRDLAKTYAELEEAIALLQGVEHADAWRWEARARIDMMQFDQAIALTDAHADTGLLRALAYGSRFQLRRHQAQYAVGDAHMEKRLVAELEPLQKAAAAATEGVELTGSLGERLRGGAPGDYTLLLIQIGDEFRKLLGVEVRSAQELEQWRTAMGSLLQALDGAVSIQPSRPEAYAYRGIVRHRIVFKGGAKAEEVLPMLDAALKDFERAKEKAQALGLPMDAFRCNVAGAQLAYAEQQVAAGGMLEAASKIQSALENAGAVATADATHAAAFYIIARAFHLQNALDNACKAYEKTLDHGNADDVQTRMHYTAALNDLGFGLLDVRREDAVKAAAAAFGRSLELLAPILEAQADSALATVRRGQARLGKGRAQMMLRENADEAFKGALEDIGRVATARPDDVDALYNDAEAKLWHGMYVAERDKVDPFEPLEPAVAACGAVLAKEPKRVQAYLLRSECRKASALFRQEKGTEYKPLLVEALADAEAAIVANDKYVDAWLLAGELHALDGNAAAAKEAYASVAELEPRLKDEMERRIKALGGG